MKNDPAKNSEKRKEEGENEKMAGPEMETVKSLREAMSAVKVQNCSNIRRGAARI